MLLKKIISGIVVGALVALAEVFSPFIWFLAVCAVAVFANYEFQKIGEEKQYRQNFKLITFFIMLFMFITYTVSNIVRIDGDMLQNLKNLLIPINSLGIHEWKFIFMSRISSVQNFILGIVFLSIVTISLFYKPRLSIGSISFSFLRVIYLGFFPSFLILLRSIPRGAEFLFIILLAGASCDIFAYVFGKNFGKTPFFNELSPNKTLEGSIGGTVSCIIITMIGGFLMGAVWYHSFILGLIIAIFSQMGDLIESLFKRNVGIKDTGNVIPGHGGIMDRIDSYIFLGFPIYFYLLYFSC